MEAESSSTSVEDKKCIQENIQKNTETESVNACDENDDFNIKGTPEEYKDTYQAYINKIKARASIPITESVTPQQIADFKHFNLRYYEDRYCINFAVSGTGYSDVLIRIHSNKMFLISLASGNEIIRNEKDITGINFMINNSDRSEVKLDGKRKKGAKVIEPQTILCQVKCEGMPNMFNIRAGVPGRIIEINEHVKKNPNLLRTDPRGYGYLAVVAPKGHPSQYEEVMNGLKLLSHDEYIKYLFERTPKFSELSKELILKYTQ